MRRHVLDLEQERSAGLDARGDQVLHDLLLAVDRDAAAAGELVERDPVAAAAEAQLHAVVDESLALEALADAHLDQELDRALLQHARADAPLDVLAVAVLEDHGLDALEMEQLPEDKPRGTRADDSDLRAGDVLVRSRGSPLTVDTVTAQSSGRGLGRRGWRSLVTGTDLIVAGCMPGFLAASLAPRIRADFAFGDSTLGLAIALFYVVSALGSVPAGRLVDRVGAAVGHPADGGVHGHLMRRDRRAGGLGRQPDRAAADRRRGERPRPGRP